MHFLQKEAKRPVQGTVFGVRLEIELLRQDIEVYRNLKTDKPSKLKEEFRNASEKARKVKQPRKERGNDRGYEPEI